MHAGKVIRSIVLFLLVSFLCVDFVLSEENSSFADSLIIFGRSQFEQGRSTQALSPLLKAERIAKETNNLNQLKQIYTLLGLIYEDEGEFREASEYYKKLSSISEKIAQHKIEAGYDADNVIPLKEYYERLKVKRKNDLILFSIILLSLIITAIVFFIFQSRRKKHQIGSIIDNQTKDLEKKNVELKNEIQKILREEEKFKTLFNTSTQSIFIHDIKTLQIVDVNDCACETYGCTREELLSMRIDDLSSSSMISPHSQQTKDFIKRMKEGEIINVEWEALRADGTLFWQDIHAKIDLIDGQERLLIFARNIDEKKKFQNELEKSKKLLQTIILNLPLACYACDIDGQIILQSQVSIDRWGNMIGKSFDDLPFDNFAVNNTLKQKWKMWWESAYNGQKINDEYSIQIDGVKKYFNTRIIPLKEKGYTIGILGMDIDITDLKKNEMKLMNLKDDLQDMVDDEVKKRKIQQELLVQKSKLESLGQLAAGIAHEINQPIGLISLGIDNINERMKSNQEISHEYLREKINKFFTYIERIRQIIDHIGTFSRDQKDITYDEIDVNTVVTEALSMIRTQCENQGINFNISLAEQLPFILGNKFKLEQVILNLPSNARDAIEQKFVNEVNEKKLISISTYPKDKNVIIKITDNGIGIPKKDIEHIFEPFYTTKEPDKGTGLGLSVSYGIIEEMKAEVDVESKPGIYTTFNLKFKALTK